MRHFTRTLVCLALLSAAGGAAWSSAAEAMTVSGPWGECSGSHGECYEDDVMGRVTAGPAEHNDVTLTAGVGVGEPRWRIEDRTAPITVKFGVCTAIDAHTVTCPTGRLTIALGDGDDTIHAVGPLRESVAVSGGAGDDTIDFSASHNRGRYGVGILEGGAGDDTMVGAPGGSLMYLSSGHDRLEAGGPNAFLSLSAGWDVDLRAGTAVQGTDRTDLIGFNAAGIWDRTAGGVLRGDDRPNRLASEVRTTIDGRGGDDDIEGLGRLLGGAGDDHLYVKGSSDIDAGPGDDWVSIESDGWQGVDCGSGVDSVLMESASILHLAADCEIVRSEWEAGDVAAHPHTGRKRMSVRVSCAFRTKPCRGRLRIGGLVGSVAYVVPGGRTGTARLALGRHRPGRDARGRTRMTVTSGPHHRSRTWLAATEG